MHNQFQAHIDTQQPPIRSHLLTGVLAFTQVASPVSGVIRIALIGSLATSKAEPKDADALVTITDEADLTLLAAHGRKLLGHCQSRNRGSDIFLAHPSVQYLGRLCSWKRCEPGIRVNCDALHCGQRHYLHDDLTT